MGHRNALLVKHAASELPAELLVRVHLCVALFERSGRRLTKLVFAVAPRTDPESAAARITIARALLKLLSARGDGELLFWADALDSSERARLLALVEALLVEPGAPRASVRVRFATHSATRRENESPRHAVDVIAHGPARRPPQ